MCHMFLLNVEFSNACLFQAFQCHFSTVLRFLFPSFQLPSVDTPNRVLEVARILPTFQNGVTNISC